MEIHLIYSVAAAIVLLCISLLYVMVFLKVRATASRFRRNRFQVRDALSIRFAVILYLLKLLVGTSEILLLRLSTFVYVEQEVSSLSIWFVTVKNKRSM